jgi:hypothetical protein
MLRTHRILWGRWWGFLCFSILMEHRWNEIDRGSRSTRRKTWLSATLSTTNPTWTDPGSNPGLSDERTATNRLSHGTVLHMCCSAFGISIYYLGRDIWKAGINLALNVFDCEYTCTLLGKTEIRFFAMVQRRFSEKWHVTQVAKGSSENHWFTERANFCCYFLLGLLCLT